MTVRRDVTAGGRWLDRRSAARLVSDLYFPVTKRAIERWPLDGKLLNGRFMIREADLHAYCAAKLRSAPAARHLRC